jgi:NAD(P)-dependent dehydrogenase (short-subunit alcohol dehydrogenase family)
MVSRIFITGSSDGIGLAAAKVLSEQGHKVTLHARNQDRATQAKAALPEIEGVLIGDLTSIESTKQLAAEANKNGPWDAVVHNAGIGLSGTEGNTGDGMAKTFQVNSLAPYILTSLMEKPKKLLYVSSSLHLGGDPSLNDVTWKERRFQPSQAYNDR